MSNGLRNSELGWTFETEIFQLQETSEINDYGTDDIIRRDINCNLGSLNIVNVMENKEIREAVHAGMEALTAVSDMTIIPNAPTVKKQMMSFIQLGLAQWTYTDI